MGYDDVRLASTRTSRATGFTLSFVTGIVVGMLATFAAITGRIAAVEVQIASIVENVRAMQQEQREQRAQLETFATQLARLPTPDDQVTTHGDSERRRGRPP